MRPRRPTILFLGGGLLAPLILIALLVGGAQAGANGVQADNSQANVIATGSVVRSDPANAEVAVSNNYHFWTAVDLQTPVGTVNLRMANLLQDAGGLWAGAGLIPGGGRAVWQGTFDAAQGSSQAAFVHFDLQTAGGASALAGTVLSIVADTFGDTIMVGSPEALKAAVNGIAQGSDWEKLVEIMQKPAEHPNPLEAVPALMDLLGTSGGSNQISRSLGEVGVDVPPQQVRGLGTLWNLLSFAQTLYDLVQAGAQGHTSGVVNFYTPGAPGSPAGSESTTAPAPSSTATLQETTTTELPATTTETLASTTTLAPTTTETLATTSTSLPTTTTQPPSPPTTGVLPGGWWLGPTPSQGATVSVGQTITLSAHVEDNGNGGLSYGNFTYFNPAIDNSWHVLETTQFDGASSGNMSATYVVPPGTTSLRVSFDVYSSNGSRHLAPQGVRDYSVAG
jgi:hypothetical protein